MIVRPGDIFCSRSEKFLGKAIRFITKIHSADNKVTYNHVGIVLSNTGETLEALGRGIKRQNLSDYKGKKVLIGRPSELTMDGFKRGLNEIVAFEGHIYPYWRFVFHLMGMSKYMTTGKFMVCSELADIFLYNAGVIGEFKGRNPDQIADMIHRWKAFDVVFEGVI